ncbi:MAG: DNRLRE domain-containing protein [Gammaproteobacteria bacterium]|nr:DNRLRE domain-containing protein [Gammaproteobacteria bacterium]
MKTPTHQGGYLLITVIVTLSLLATVALLLTLQSSVNANTASAELQTARVDYVTEAGMQNALWRVQNNACMGNMNIPATSLGADSYTATITGAADGTAYSLSVDQDAWIRSDDVSKTNGTASDQHIKFESGNIEQSLTRFDLTSLAADARINSAIAWFYVAGTHEEGPVTVHRVTAEWTETDATWESIGGKVENTILATVSAQPANSVWVSVNLTAQVQAWVNGQPNFGILMASTSEGVHGKYASREDGGNAPRLEVVVGSGPASPVDIEAVGTLANGTTRSLRRSAMSAYQPPVIRTITPNADESADAEIWAQAANNNYGDAAEIWVSSASNDTTRTLLRFDLGGIPSGARVIDASLSLHRQSGSGPDQPVSAHRIRNQWSEDSVTWNEREAGTDWDTAGGDFDDNPLATTAVGPANERYEWGITPLVQSWLDGSFPNYGVAMIAATDGMAGERFYTSDQAQFDRRPSLSIKFACECGSACMAPVAAGSVLLVIGNSPSNPSAEEEALRKQLENWGYSVTLIQDDDSQGNFNSASTANDVVLVSDTVNSANVGTKLTSVSTGVVSAEHELADELGIATGSATAVSDTMTVTDSSHYITSIFTPGPISVKTAATSMSAASGTISPGANVLAGIGSDSALVALDTGAAMANGGTTVGRRVLVPLGNGSAGWNYLSNDGALVIQRALAWATNADAVEAGKLLLVVANTKTLTSEEKARQALIETWGYAVAIIDDSESESALDTAALSSDVVYVSEDVDHRQLGDKLRSTAKGIVVEEQYLFEEFGFSTARSQKFHPDIDVIDNSHYIMSEFETGLLDIYTTAQMSSMVINPGNGLRVLAELENTGSDWDPTVATIETGAEMVGGGFAPARRAKLPFVSIAEINSNGQLLMRRAIEWAAGADIDLGPAVHWKLDEASGEIAADSVGGHDGSLFNGPVWAAGKRDGALRFDGSNDFVEVPHSDALPLTTIFTVAAWVRNDSPSISATYRIISKEPAGANDNFWMAFSAGWLWVGIDGDFISPSTNFMPDTWYHLAVTYDDAGDSVQIYVNGALVLSDTTSASITMNTAPVFIGSNWESSKHWQGLLDDIRIYDRVLSASEVAELAGIGSGLLAHWKLDETSGTTAIDSLGGYDGTLMNMDPSTDWVTGQIDGGLSFDGGNDYIDVSSMNPKSYDDFAISAWYKSESTTATEDEYIFLHAEGFVTNGITFGPTDDGGDVLRLTIDVNGESDRHYGTSDIVDRQWHHLVATRSNGRVRIFVDGVEESDETDAHAGTIVAVDGAGPFIGDYPGNTEQVNGTLDDIRLFDYGLSPDEIAELFGAGGGSGSPVFCDGTFRDEFNRESYAGNDGTLSWATDWLEINESNGWDSGDEQVVDEDSDYHLQVRDNMAAVRACNAKRTSLPVRPPG